MAKEGLNPETVAFYDSGIYQRGDQDALDRDFSVDLIFSDPDYSAWAAEASTEQIEAFALDLTNARREQYGIGQPVEPEPIEEVPADTTESREPEVTLFDAEDEAFYSSDEWLDTFRLQNQDLLTEMDRRYTEEAIQRRKEWADWYNAEERTPKEKSDFVQSVMDARREERPEIFNSGSHIYRIEPLTPATIETRDRVNQQKPVLITGADQTIQSLGDDLGAIYLARAFHSKGGETLSPGTLKQVSHVLGYRDPLTQEELFTLIEDSPDVLNEAQANLRADRKALKDWEKETRADRNRTYDDTRDQYEPRLKEIEDSIRLVKGAVPTKTPGGQGIEGLLEMEIPASAERVAAFEKVYGEGADPKEVLQTLKVEKEALEAQQALAIAGLTADYGAPISHSEVMKRGKIRPEALVPVIGAVPEMVELMEVNYLLQKDAKYIEEHGVSNLSLRDQARLAKFLAGLEEDRYGQTATGMMLPMLADMVPYAIEFAFSMGTASALKAGGRRALYSKMGREVYRKSAQFIRHSPTLQAQTVRTFAHIGHRGLVGTLSTMYGGARVGEQIERARMNPEAFEVNFGFPSPAVRRPPPCGRGRGPTSAACTWPPVRRRPLLPRNTVRLRRRFAVSVTGYPRTRTCARDSICWPMGPATRRLHGPCGNSVFTVLSVSWGKRLKTPCTTPCFSGVSARTRKTPGRLRPRCSTGVPTTR
jgi:hypothetical protein